MKRIIVSVTNDLVTDQRVSKVCSTLSKLNFEILLIGRELKDSLPYKPTYKTKRIKLIFNKGVLFYTEFNIRLFLILLFSKKNVLLSNDLDTLLPNYLISKLNNIPLVFDSHELFSELPSIQGRYSQKVWRFLERKLISKPNSVITVSDSISKWFLKKYNINSIVIKNFPTLKKTQFLENKNNYIIYQGALNHGRGLIPLLSSMQNIENTTLKIVGDGPIKSLLENKIKHYQLEKKVQLLGLIPPFELFHLTQNAALGLSLEEDIGLSYQYALPNKLFDYIQAQIPVVTTYLPEIKNIVHSFNVGEVIKDHSPISIENSIKIVLKNGKNHYRSQLDIASKKLIWEKQEEQLLNIFRKI